MTFSDKHFTGRAEVTKILFDENILKVRLTIPVNERYSEWDEDWNLDHTMIGFEDGEYFRKEFPHFPPTQTELQSQEMQN